MKDGFSPNLYAEITPGGIVKQVIMPDKNGSLPPVPAGKDWYGIKWPTNPHHTGVRLIRQMLEAGFPHRVPA